MTTSQCLSASKKILTNSSRSLEPIDVSADAPTQPPLRGSNRP